VRGKRRSLRLRIPIVAAVVAVAGCATVPFIETALDAAAHAQSSSDRSSRTHSQPDWFLQSWFRLRTQRSLRRPSGSSSVVKHYKTKPKPKQNATTSEKPTARSIQPTIAANQNVPLPRPRPTAGLEPLTFAEAAGPNFDTADVTSAPSDCDERLRTIAVIELLPRLIGAR
jgi:hypothetical protein